MKKQMMFILSVVGLLLLAACGGTTAPTAEPAVAPVSSISEPETVVETEPEVDSAVAVETTETEAVEAEAMESETETEMVAEEAAEVEVMEEEMEDAEVADAEMVAVVGTTDFGQIGKTGRPQFFNSFATW